MSKIPFSISMCVYEKDNPEQFDAALNSVIEQTYKPDEIVLVVDGPVPDSIDTIIAKYDNNLSDTDIYFKTIRLQKNVGHGEARRICFDKCTNEIIALMDADDLSVPDRFEKQITFLSKNSNVSVVGGNITEFITHKDPKDISQTAGMRIVPSDNAEIRKYIKKRCPMNQVTVMFKKSDVASVGGYIDWYCEEDYYLWIRMFLGKKILANIPESLVNVRVDEQMYQRRGGWRYFKSEMNLQRYMLKENIINPYRFLLNVLERFVVQVMMPNNLRGWVFRKLARN